jgi:hypothetical protein
VSAGRKPLPEGERLTHAITVRLTADEGAALEAFCADLALEPAVWVRSALRRAMRNAPRCPCGRVATMARAGTPVCETCFTP